MATLNSMQELLDLIKDYRANHQYEMSALESYSPAMPMVSSKKVAVFRALVNLLKSENTKAAKGALESSQDLRDGLLYSRNIAGEKGKSHMVIFFDQERLDMIVQKFVALYEEQLNKPASELLQEQKQQQGLVDDLAKDMHRLLLLYGQTNLIHTGLFNSRSLRAQSRTNGEWVIRDVLGSKSELDVNPKYVANKMDHTVLVDIQTKYKDLICGIVR